MFSHSSSALNPTFSIMHHDSIQFILNVSSQDLKYSYFKPWLPMSTWKPDDIIKVRGFPTTTTEKHYLTIFTSWDIFLRSILTNFRYRICQCPLEHTTTIWGHVSHSLGLGQLCHENNKPIKSPTGAGNKFIVCLIVHVYHGQSSFSRLFRRLAPKFWFWSSDEHRVRVRVILGEESAESLAGSTQEDMV